MKFKQFRRTFKQKVTFSYIKRKGCGLVNILNKDVYDETDTIHFGYFGVGNN